MGRHFDRVGAKVTCRQHKVQLELLCNAASMLGIGDGNILYRHLKTRLLQSRDLRK